MPIRSPPVRASSKESATRTVTTGPRVSPQMHERVVGRAGEHGRRVEEARPVQGLAAGEQLRARVDGVLDLPVHPHALVVVDQRPELGARGRGPARSASARARAASASRNGSATAWCTCTRSTDPHDWPAPANALDATSSAAHSGSTPASITTRWLPAASSPGRITRSTPGMGRERLRGALVAVQDLQDVAQVEQLDHALRGQRRLLGRLEDDGVAGDQRRRERAAGGGERVGTTASGSRRRRAAHAPRGHLAGRGARSSGPSSA